MNEERKAGLLLVAVVCLWGLNVVMIKFLTGFFDPITLGAWRIGAAALLLTLLVWRMGGLIKLPLRDWLPIIGIAVFGIWLHQMTLSIGLLSTTASIGALILGMNPLVMIVLAYLFFREPLTKRKVIGVLLGFAGVTLVVFGESWEQLGTFTFGKGEILIVIAMLVYVVSGLCIKRATQTVPVITVTAYSHIVGTLLLAVTSFVQGTVTGRVTELPADWFVWGVLLFSGWVSSALGNVWWNSGIRIIGAGRTAMYLNASPIWGLVFSMLFLGERIGWVHVIGFTAVFIAIFFGTGQGRTAPVAAVKPSA